MRKVEKLDRSRAKNCDAIVVNNYFELKKQQPLMRIIRTAMILMIVGSFAVFVVRESPRTTVEHLFFGSTVTSMELGSTLTAQDHRVCSCCN